MSLPDTRMKKVIRSLSALAPVILGVLMFALWLTPYQLWERALYDAVYQGFDPNLIKIDRRGIAQSEGVVEVSPDLLRLVAVPESNPRVRLGSTPKDFNVSMDVKIVQSDPGTKPLSIDLWQWRNGATYSLAFGPSPSNHVIARAVQGTRVIKEEILGTYSLGQMYHVQLTVDREQGVITSRFEGRGGPPSGSNWVVLTNAAPHEPRYVELVSDMLPVEEGEQYEFGATVKLAGGYGNFKLNVFWFDPERKMLSWAPPVGWHSPRDLEGWTKQQFVASAPRGAAFATLVASAGNSTYFMTDFFLRRVSSRSVNLLPNGRLKNGLDGWTLVEPGIGVSTEKPTVGIPHQVHLMSSIDSTEAPELFLARLDAVWSLQAFSSFGTSIAEAQNYSVVVPPQTWRGSSLWGVRLKDPAATRLVLALFVAGCLLVTLAAGRWGLRNATKISLRRWHTATEAYRSIARFPWTFPVGATILACLVLNVFLFRLGYHLIDFNAAKIWSYIGMRYGVAELYSLTALVTTGEPWTGAAVKQADFPYGPTMAYLFAFIGWLYRGFLAGPKGPTLEGFELAFVVKSVILLFVLADAALIYFIVRTLKVSGRLALLATMLFLLNPAVWFVGSIWGETQAMSLFFFLLAILFAQKRQPTGAWMSLMLSVLSRPQLWLPSLLLGLVCLRRFSVEENMRSMAWSVIVAFMMLLPFHLALGPSSLINWIVGTVDVQTPVKEVVGPDMAASLGAYNLWPLISPLTLNASGYNRMWFPSVEPFLGGWTYSQVSTLLTLVIELLLMVYVLITPRVARSNGGYIPVLAVSLLGLLLFRTGVSSHHFILALPLLIAAKKWVSDRIYYGGVGILTLTTFVSVAGDFIYHMHWKGIGDIWMPALYPGNHVVTRFLLALYQTDWIITLGASSNLAVFLWLGWEAIRPFWSFGRRRHGEIVSVPADPSGAP